MTSVVSLQRSEIGERFQYLVLHGNLAPTVRMHLSDDATWYTYTDAGRPRNPNRCVGIGAAAGGSKTQKRGEIDELTRNMRLGIFMLGFAVKAEGMCSEFQTGAAARMRGFVCRGSAPTRRGVGGVGWALLTARNA
ncbi:hypothetical protein GW17_00024481 [Ensete ventricosum]|nr:hypothetical protein GW17_00024481 [Ensete ventricosum]